VNISKSFEILEIAPDASYQEAKSAYRTMCQVWHPDKHTHSEQLHAKATIKIKEINAAWSLIQKYFKDGGKRDTNRSYPENYTRKDGARAQRFEQERVQKKSVQSKQDPQGVNERQFLSKKADLPVVKIAGAVATILVFIVLILFITNIYYNNKRDDTLLPALVQHRQQEVSLSDQKQLPSNEIHAQTPEKLSANKIDSLTPVQLPADKTPPPITKELQTKKTPAAPLLYNQLQLNSSNTTSLSDNEKIALNNACSRSQSQGQAAYNQCIHEELSGSQNLPDSSYLSNNERVALINACSNARSQGLAAYRQCVGEEMADLQRLPDISYLSGDEKTALEKACSNSQLQGLAVYRQCIREELTTVIRAKPLK
jgi:curved DNA-binding protein CbpA